MKLYNVQLTVGSDLLAQSIVAGKTNAVKTAKRWISETEDVRRAEVFEIGNELQMWNHGVEPDQSVESQMLGNGRAIFSLDAK